MDTIELRNYLLKPGTRDRFIDYFKQHFIESQTTLGAYIPGLFRIKDEPDRFFWIRGFNDMPARSVFLPAFYGGDIWKEYGPAANDMMLEWHNVHLAKPVKNYGMPFETNEEILVIDYYNTRDDQPGRLIDLYTEKYIPLLNDSGIRNVTLWVSEPAANDFPRLPVYQHRNCLIVITSYRSGLEYELVINRLTTYHKDMVNQLEEMINDKRSLALYPVLHKH